MIPALGTACLMLLLPTALYSLGMTIIGGHYRDARQFRSGLHATYSVVGLLTLAAGLVVTAFVGNHFEMAYVAASSSRALALPYKLAGLWAGLDGSLLFWVWLLALMHLVVIVRMQERLSRHIAMINAVVMCVVLFFGLLLLVEANPFTTTLDVPMDGRGLNPLLQSPLMVIHPPMLYLGYVSATIPFALVIAGLVTREMDERWLQAVRSWVLFCWFFLSVGNLLGMYWAYVELGWGGFWAWDPVENAAIMPWFTASAFLHSIIIQERRGMLRMWNVVLATLTFLLTVFGTFLTRSGIVQSVHAFSNSTLGVYFASFLVVCAVASAALIVRRRRTLASRNQLESIMSKEGAFLLNNVFLTVGCFAILWGTMLPTMTEWLFDERLTLGPAFFNTVITPFGFGLLALAGFGPVMAWRRAESGALLRVVRWPAVIGVVALGTGALWGLRDWRALVGLLLGGFTLAITLAEFGRGLRVVHAQTPKPLVAVPGKLLRRAQRRYGGYVVHIGLLVIFAGFIGALYRFESDVHLKEGERTTVRGYELEFGGLRYRQDDHLEAVAGELRVFRDGAPVSVLLPARHFYRASEQPTTEVAIYRSGLNDLYTILGAFDVDAHAADFKIMHHPLINAIWLGGGLLVLGTLIIIWPRRQVVVAALLLCGMLGMVVAPAMAAVPAGEAVTSAARRMVCLCDECARQNLAECMCPFAADKRKEIRALIDAGYGSDSAVLAMVERDGEAILAAPPLAGWRQLALWVPFGALGCALAGVIVRGSRCEVRGSSRKRIWFSVFRTSHFAPRTPNKKI